MLGARKPGEQRSCHTEGTAATAARRLCRCISEAKTTQEEQAMLAVGAGKAQEHLGPGHCEAGRKYASAPSTGIEDITSRCLSWRPCPRALDLVLLQLGTVAVVLGGHGEDSLKDNIPAQCNKRPGHFHVHGENKREE